MDLDPLNGPCSLQPAPDGPLPFPEATWKLENASKSATFIDFNGNLLQKVILRGMLKGF